jgi:hypothetical protein
MLLDWFALRSWRWGQYVPRPCWWASAAIHSLTYQKTTCQQLWKNLRSSTTYISFRTVGFYTVFIVQAYQTSQYVMPCGGKCRSSFAGSPDGKMNVQSACTLNTRYIPLRGVKWRAGLNGTVYCVANWLKGEPLQFWDDHTSVVTLR